MSPDGRVRLADPEGRFSRAAQRLSKLGGQLPSVPAATNTYDRSGTAAVYVFDLDAKAAKNRSSSRAAHDFGLLRAQLDAAGLDFFADTSISGGYHLYVPVAGGLTYSEISTVDRMLEHWLVSFDKMPHTGLTHGCIRFPFSPHKNGGLQRLVDRRAWRTVLTGDALEAEVNRALKLLAATPNPRKQWDVFVRQLVRRTPAPGLTGTQSAAAAAVAGTRPGSVPGQPVFDRLSVTDLRELDLAALPHLAPRSRRRDEPTGMWKRLAVEGHDSSVYASASQTRFAVVLSAVSAGMSALDVYMRAFFGDWKGLGHCYGRYGNAHLATSFKRDWLAAVAIETSRRNEHDNDSRERVHHGTTSRQEAQGAPHSGWVRSWLEAAEQLAVSRKWSLAVRAVLAALAFMSADKNTPFIAVGNRSLATAVNLDQATVGKILRQLLADESPLVRVTTEAQGIYARELELLIPSDVEHLASGREWRKGRLHPVRPAFYVLGHAAAFTYGALETESLDAGVGLSARQVAQAARISPTTAAAALRTLAEFDLATSTEHGWVIGTGDADDVGRRLGGEEQKKARVLKHRAERRAWHERLGLHLAGDADEMIAQIENVLTSAARSPAARRRPGTSDRRPPQREPGWTTPTEPVDWGTPSEPPERELAWPLLEPHSPGPAAMAACADELDAAVRLVVEQLGAVQISP
ncbi:hypothetical protein [Aeromicrobium massiliense]|uniref:hypothetical protein n=1 Tax=Aeromicrobium massiliense TaxID=1464554 RepID=UPI000ADC65F2|nr:hypothetical protein [Aeromicrobium massiliense]